MPVNWVHQALSLIAFGLPYASVHRRKDAYSRKVPGSRHRAVRHRKYQAYGRSWDFDTLHRAHDADHLQRVTRWKGPVISEQFQVSVAHDIDDRLWDYDDSPLTERPFRRKCLEAWCAWLVLNPSVLRAWAHVDVLGGRIHRVIDGAEIWEEEPELIPAYEALRRQVLFVLRCDRRLREGVVAFQQSYDPWRIARQKCLNIRSSS